MMRLLGSCNSVFLAEDEAIINDFLRRHGVKPEQSAVTTDASSDQTKEAHQASKES
jgi:hypothetical protein